MATRLHISANAQEVLWEGADSTLLPPPRLKQHDLEPYLAALSQHEELSGHIFLFTSGSSGQAKLVALSKRAMLVAAEAVNNHLETQSNDRWLCALPHHHVGGLAIFARAKLAGCEVQAFKGAWDAADYVSCLLKYRSTLSALVPTQVFDLATSRLRCPPALRALVAGGGSLSAELYADMRELGWPILPSYGLTEACSQVATAALDSLRNSQVPGLKLLPHWRARVGNEQHLELKGESLLTCYIGSTGVISDPKRHGWFATNDRADLKDLPEATHVQFRSRSDLTVKISGELVSLSTLENELACVLGNRRFALIAIPHQRLEHSLVLAVEGDQPGDAPSLLQNVNEKMPSFARVTSMRFVDNWPLSDAMKVDRERLRLLMLQ